MHILSFPRSITRILVLLFILGSVSFLFAQEEITNRGFIQNREIPETKKGTVVFKSAYSDFGRDVFPEPKRGSLSDAKKRARFLRGQGWELQSFGYITSALGLYKKAVALDPDYAVAYNDLGVIYEAAGRLDLAEKYYLKAITVDRYYLSAYSNLALFYERIKQPDKAAFYWKRRVELGCPGDPWLEKAKEHLGNMGSAVREEVDVSSDADTPSEEKIMGLVEEALEEADSLE
jgi:tetratricopeptide (TPR) repeat protein